MNNEDYKILAEEFNTYMSKLYCQSMDRYEAAKGDRDEKTARAAFATVDKIYNSWSTAYETVNIQE